MIDINPHCDVDMKCVVAAYSCLCIFIKIMLMSPLSAAIISPPSINGSAIILAIVDHELNNASVAAFIWSEKL